MDSQTFFPYIFFLTLYTYLTFVYHEEESYVHLTAHAPFVYNFTIPYYLEIHKQVKTLIKAKKV